MDVINQVVTDNYAIYNGDSCEVIKGIKDDSVGLTVYSPPFADLYCYSDSIRDMGNCKNYDEFFNHFKFLAKEIYRVMKPGRVMAVHCMDIPAMKERDGYIGIKNFSGDLINLFNDTGFIYHSRVTIWKDPLTEATRTKALGLMHKQIEKDSSMCRNGLPDYIIAFRKPGENDTPICNPDGFKNKDYHGSNKMEFSGLERSHNIWRAYASPVWTDIRQGNTLNKNNARTEKDQKHICPLQLDVIERIVELWSTEDDIVFTPFMGIGSECYVAVKNKRKAIGIELKESYYNQAVVNVENATKVNDQGKLF